MSSAQKHDANVFLPGCLGPVNRVVVLEEDYDTLAADNKRLREALTDLLSCPAQIVQETVPRAGIEAAPPYQVALDVSVALTRWRKAKAALACSGEGDV